MRYLTTIHVSIEADDETQAEIFLQETILDMQEAGTESTILWFDDPMVLTPHVLEVDE